MCLILIAHKTHTVWPLVVAANRDEFYQRPSAAAHFWPHANHLLAGRDLEAGGTWMGVTRSGRFAAVTNYRNPAKNNTPVKSRGALVANFLTGCQSADQFAEHSVADGASYNGFNLLLHDGNKLVYCNNFTDELQTLGEGIFGLSNHALDTPWPKVERGKSHLVSALNGDNKTTQADLHSKLLSALADDTPAPDHQLPKTGISMEWERSLAPMFIAAGHYGTCCSTVFTVNHQRQAAFSERRYYSAQQNLSAQDDQEIHQFEWLITE